MCQVVPPAAKSWVESARRLGHFAAEHLWARAAIERLLSSPSSELRMRAAPALCALAAAHPPALDDLSRMCSDPDPKVQEAAGQWLVQACIANGDALDATEQALGLEAQVRAGIARGMGEAGRLSDAAFDLLFLLACDDEGRVRAAAIESLGIAGAARPKRAVAGLNDLLFFCDDGDEYINQGAAPALAQLLSRKAPGALKLAARLACDSSDSRRWCAARALAGAAKPQAAATNRVLQTLARDRSPLVRAELAMSAGALAGADAVTARALLEHLSSDNDAFVRSAAVEATGPAVVAGEKWALEALRGFSTAADHNLRLGAAAGLGAAACASATPVVALLCQLARDSWGIVRSRAAVALGGAWRAAPRARVALLALAKDANPEVRAAAARSLGTEVEDPQVAEAVWRTLDALRRDDYAAVRRSAIVTIGQMAAGDAPRAIEMLAQHLGEEHGPELAQALAAALAHHGAGRAWAAARIAVAARSEDFIREMAQAACDSITADVMSIMCDILRAEPLEDHVDRLAALSEMQDSPEARALAETARTIARMLRASKLEDLGDPANPMPRMPDSSRFLAFVPDFDEEKTFKPGFDHIRGAQKASLRQEKIGELETALALLQTRRREVADSPAVVYRHVGGRLLAVLGAVLSTVLRALRDQAEVCVELLPARIYKCGPEISVALHLRNEGSASALNVRVRAQAAPPYWIGFVQTDSQPELAPEEHILLSLRLTAVEPDGGRDVTVISGDVDYDDPDGGRRRVDFACKLELEPLPPHVSISHNPFVPGKPLAPSSPMFVGRDGVFDFLRQTLHGAHQENVVCLIGPRRIGKTSILRQAEKRLGDLYLPVLVDVQGMLVDNVGGLLHALAERCRDAAAPEVNIPARLQFDDDPTLLPRFLQQLTRSTGEGKRLLLMLDEFDDLEQKVRSGLLPESVFTYLRHLIQHSPGIAFLLSGTNRLEELAEDYWSFLFNLAIYRKVGRLWPLQTRRAVTETMAQAGIACDDLVAHRVWELSGGHPYFLQLVGHHLVNCCQRASRSYVTYDMVEASGGEILEWGDAHLGYLWELADVVEQAVMVVIHASGRAGTTAAGVAEVLRSHACHLSPAAIARALDGLVEKDLMTQVKGAPYRYKPAMGILGAWIDKRHPLSRVARRAAPAA